MSRALMVLILFFASLANAKEGFNTDFTMLPHAVQKWQDRVFMVSIYGFPWATAFLVHSEPGKLHFLTARHVAVKCSIKCTLTQSAVREGRHGETTGTRTLEVRARNVVVFEPKGDSWKDVGLEGTDMGYFTTESFPGAPEASFEELVKLQLPKLPEDEPVSQKHFILGYPHLTSRPSLDTEENQAYRLRWSEGDLILKNRITGGGGFFRRQTETNKFRMMADADSLGGNSGGPVVRADGTLLGILYGGPTGSNYKTSFHSYYIPIDYIRVFLKAIEMKHPAAFYTCSDPREASKPHCQEGQ